MRNQWQMWRSAINPDFCDKIIQQHLAMPPEDATTFNSANDYRSSKIRWVQDKEIREILWWYAQEANRQAFGFDVENVGGIQFTEYGTEYGGKYDWHHDVDWQSDAAFDRKISVVLQLSDGKYYEGCDFQFDEVQNPDPDALRAKGTIICFPSYLRHRVTEITKGSRYSLVAWFEGPRWR